MNRLALSLSVMFAFCLGAFNGFSQEVAPLSTFSNQRASLPRYNFWIEGYVGDNTYSYDTKSAFSSKDYWDETGMGVLLSFDYCFGRKQLEILGQRVPVSFYFGGGAGFKKHTYSDLDGLSGKKQMSPHYVGPEVFFSFVLGDWFSAFMEAGWRTDFLVGSSFKSEGRGLIGMGPDCFTPVLHSLIIQSGIIMGRIRLGWRLEWTFTPVVSSDAMEYYTGAAFTADSMRVFRSFYISFLLGGTDR